MASIFNELGQFIVEIMVDAPPVVIVVVIVIAIIP